MRRDGGPAFARPVGSNNARSIEDLESNSGDEGMSLRDYFAASALQGSLSGLGLLNISDAARFARQSYALADAMLEERKK